MVERLSIIPSLGNSTQMNIHQCSDSEYVVQLVVRKYINNKDSKVIFTNWFECSNWAFVSSYIKINMHITQRFPIYVLFWFTQFYINLHLAKKSCGDWTNLNKISVTHNIVRYMYQSILDTIFRILQLKMWWYEQSKLKLVSIKILDGAFLGLKCSY